MTQSYIPALRFHTLTRIYDPVVALMSDATHKRELVRGASIEPGHQVLDVGVGTATLTAAAAEVAPDASYVGVDLDDAALQIARENLELADVEATLVKGSATSLPFADDSFDRVVTSLVLHHLTNEDKLEALAQMRRVLRPGGQLHVLDWSRPQNAAMRLAFLAVQLLDGFETTSAHAEGALPEIMRSAGFELVAHEERATVFGTLGIFRLRAGG